MKNIFIYITLILYYTLVIPIHAEDLVKNATPIGLAEYKRSCAVCHGLDAKGNGVMAVALKNTPADLTKISKQNDGKFPHERIYKTIEGLDQLTEHGTREMPIWGEKYRKEAHLTSEDEHLYLRGRMFELMIYLQSIQE